MRCAAGWLKLTSFDFLEILVAWRLRPRFVHAYSNNRKDTNCPCFHLLLHKPVPDLQNIEDRLALNVVPSSLKLLEVPLAGQCF